MATFLFLLGSLAAITFAAAGLVGIMGFRRTRDRLVRIAIGLALATVLIPFAVASLGNAAVSVFGTLDDVDAPSAFVIALVVVGHVVLGAFLVHRKLRAASRTGRGDEAERVRARERVRLPPGEGG